MFFLLPMSEVPSSWQNGQNAFQPFNFRISTPLVHLVLSPRHWRVFQVTMQQRCLQPRAEPAIRGSSRQRSAFMAGNRSGRCRVACPHSVKSLMPVNQRLLEELSGNAVTCCLKNTNSWSKLERSRQPQTVSAFCAPAMSVRNEHHSWAHVIALGTKASSLLSTALGRLLGRRPLRNQVSIFQASQRPRAVI